ncbi:membrane-spanning 4-domains subfamily A member 4D-like isoform X1 [Rana temporaria]|uniref:membrane-spanning 4-domains subfamily A member 4D-like isoform X1 n=1 Tax=Rana temporaria TaxID=8407 RepID=UPI001AAC7317|nr:membrane-spanning 4-domains subfamily A member 4D-like isoform X1 [Rana temporaria]
MMSASEKEGDVPGYDVMQPTIFPPNPVQPNAIPVNFQWNMNPVPAGPNGYPGAQVWNVSMPPPHIIFQNNNQQWTVQPLPPGYPGSPAMPPATFPATPQDTRLAALHKTFLKGKPYALGIVLIVTSILEIAFGISVCFLMTPPSLLSGILFWGPIFYIIAGSLSISAYKKPSVCKIKGALSLNIITSIFSMITIVLNIIDFSVVKCDGNVWCSDKHGSDGFTVISFILVMNLLMFCVSVSISVFGCRAVKEIPVTAPPMFTIQNDYVVSMPPSNLAPNTTMNPFTQPQQPPPYEEEKKQKPENETN